MNMNPIEVGTLVTCTDSFGADAIVYRIRRLAARPRRRRDPACSLTLADLVLSTGRIVRGVSIATLRSSSIWCVKPERVTKAEIDAALNAARERMAKLTLEAETRAKQYASEVTSLRTSGEFAGLAQGFDIHSGTLAAKNIRRQLAERFPGVAFAVTKLDQGKIQVSWVDGPLISELRPIVGRYQGDSPGFGVQSTGQALTPWMSVFGASSAVILRRGSGKRKSVKRANKKLIKSRKEAVKMHYGQIWEQACGSVLFSEWET